MSEIHPDVNYSSGFEAVLKECAEQFSCLSKAHDMAARWAESWNSYFTIPTIILSGLSGLGAVGSSELLPFQGNTLLIGLLSFVCATLQTVASHYSFSSRAANHRNTSIQYTKLHQMISLELSLPRMERMKADKMLQIIKTDNTRLLETAPPIPTFALEKFKAEYGSLENVSIPFLLNGIEAVRILPIENEVIVTPPTPRQQRPPVKIEV